MGKLKTKDELLKDLSKSNQSRKEILANRAGFLSVEDYKKHLQSINHLEQKPKIHVVNILDISSSMDGLKFNNAFSGIVNEIKELKLDDSIDYTATFVSFSYASEIRTHYFNSPLSEVKTPIIRPYGMTALNEAVAETLEKLLLLKNEGFKTIVSIFTDGGENGSDRKYKQEGYMAEVIKRAEDSGITVTFIGTDLDVRQVTKDFNLKSSNTLVHNNTGEGVKMSFMVKSEGTRSYASKVLAGATQDELLTGFYSKQTGKL
jgi:uncharacterized protein YegL